MCSTIEYSLFSPSIIDLDLFIRQGQTFRVQVIVFTWWWIWKWNWDVILLAHADANDILLTDGQNQVNRTVCGFGAHFLLTELNGNNYSTAEIQQNISWLFCAKRICYQRFLIGVFFKVKYVYELCIGGVELLLLPLILDLYLNKASISWCSWWLKSLWVISFIVHSPLLLFCNFTN